MHSTSTLPVPPHSDHPSTPATAATPPATSYDVMERLFQPKTVAIIGASSTANTVGRALVENMAAFEGTLYLINPKHPTVLDRPAFPSVSALPTVPDLVVIATPAAGIPALLRECGKKGVPAAVVVSAGFKEVGPEGAALEKQVIEAAAESGMRIIGPNCLGVMIPHLKLNATFAADMARPGKVAFLSQSGALCTAVLDWSLRDNIGFSAFVSVGSMADLAWGDLISYFGDDPNTRSIVCYMESVGDARSFLTAAREVARDKPIIVIKVGHTEAAAKVAASHTGSLTGSDSVLDAAFQRAGVLRVNTITELFSMAEVLAKQPRPTGPRLALVTNAGGPGALATDMLITCGAKLAELEPATIATLNKVLPAPWSHGNPIDVLGDANAGRYGAAIEAANADPNVDGLLVILTPQAMTDAAATAKELQRLSAQISKPILASWMGADSTAEGQAILNAANIPTFDCPDIAAKAFALMWKHSQNLKALYETPELATQDITLHQRQAVETLIQGVRSTNRTLLTEAESKTVLRTYGIPTVETRIAVTEEEAVACGKSIGYPLVLKLLSKTITHKTDVGGVELDLRSEEAVRNAWRRIESSVTSKVGKEHFQGVTVQPMIDRGGYELILGSTIDPQFGPVILFGTGGQLVEVFKDRSLGLPPLNATLARRLMEQTRIYQALHGVRGRSAVDIDQLITLLVRFSHLVLEQRWITEIDINPLLVSSNSILALDARIVLAPQSTAESALPRAAIRPYPNNYISHWALPDGSQVLLRPIRPEDEPAMTLFHATLSEQSIYSRYFSPLRLEQRIAHDRLSRVCFLDYDREIALVAERTNPTTHGQEIIGVGRLTREQRAPEAEFALLVSDAFQKQKLGGELLRQLLKISHEEGLERITGRVLPDNHAMLRLCEQLGFKLHSEPGSHECVVVKET